MEILEEKKDDLTSVIKIKLFPEDYKGKVYESLKKFRKKTKIPGFRPGKVPVDMIKKIYGNSILFEKIQEMSIKYLYDYIDKNKLDILTEPILSQKRNEEKYDINKLQEYEFQYEIAYKPEFNLKLDNIKEKKNIVKLTKDEFDKEYEKLLNLNSTSIEVEKITDENNLVHIYLEKINNGSQEEIYDIIRVFSQFKSDILKEKLKLSASNGSFTLKAKEIVGNDNEIFEFFKMSKSKFNEIADSKYKIKIHKIYALKKPEINKEFFKKILKEKYSENIDSEEKFKNELKKIIEEQINKREELYFAKKVFKNLVENTKIDLPIDFIKRLVLRKYKSVSDEKFNEILKSLKKDLILKKFVQEKNIEFTDDEFLEYIEKNIQLDLNIDKKTLPKHLNSILQDKKELEKYEFALYLEKIYDFIIKNIKAKENKITLTELHKEIQKEKFAELEKIKF